MGKCEGSLRNPFQTDLISNPFHERFSTSFQPAHLITLEMTLLWIEIEVVLRALNKFPVLSRPQGCCQELHHDPALEPTALTMWRSHLAEASTKTSTSIRSQGLKEAAISFFFMTLRHRAHRIHCSHKWPLFPGCLLKTVNNQIKDIPHPRLSSSFISLLLTDYNECGHRNIHKHQIKCFCCVFFSNVVSLAENSFNFWPLQHAPV